FSMVLLLGLCLRKERIEFLGHWVTIFFGVAAIVTVLPNPIGEGLAFTVAAWEGWRRDLFMDAAIR
ncbi:MAG: hypothetical protein AAGA31_18260, partial [Bacteroidota bacterium]